MYLPTLLKVRIQDINKVLIQYIKKVLIQYIKCSSARPTSRNEHHFFGLKCRRNAYELDRSGIIESDHEPFRLPVLSGFSGNQIFALLNIVEPEFLVKWKNFIPNRPKSHSIQTGPQTGTSLPYLLHTWERGQGALVSLVSSGT